MKLGFACRVCPAINFNDESYGVRREISCIWPDRQLAAKLDTQLVIPHRPSDHGLGLGHRTAIAPRKFARRFAIGRRLFHEASLPH